MDRMTSTDQARLLSSGETSHSAFTAPSAPVQPPSLPPQSREQHQRPQLPEHHYNLFATNQQNGTLLSHPGSSVNNRSDASLDTVPATLQCPYRYRIPYVDGNQHQEQHVLSDWKGYSGPWQGTHWNQSTTAPNTFYNNSEARHHRYHHRNYYGTHGRDNEQERMVVPNLNGSSWPLPAPNQSLQHTTMARPPPHSMAAPSAVHLPPSAPLPNEDTRPRMREHHLHQHYDDDDNCLKSIYHVTPSPKTEEPCGSIVSMKSSSSGEAVEDAKEESLEQSPTRLQELRSRRHAQNVNTESATRTQSPESAFKLKSETKGKSNNKKSKPRSARKMQQNRESAKRFREKTKTRMIELQYQIDSLQMEMADAFTKVDILQAQNEALLEENKELKMRIATFSSSSSQTATVNNA